MAQNNTEQTDSDEILTLKGELTIDRADEFKALLLKSLENEKRLILTFEKITDVDISFLQLICSAHRSFAEKDKVLVLQTGDSEILQKAAKEAGFVRDLVCAVNPGEKCLWDRGDR